MDEENKVVEETIDNELAIKLEALQAEFSAARERLAELEEKNKALAIENQRLLLNIKAPELTDAELFAQFFK